MSGKVYTHLDLLESTNLDCDVCIIGSGAGGATLAAGLAARSLRVIMLESGSYHQQKDFDMDEAKSFQTLYQEKGLRNTADLSISILQGHCVGGSTTINWTTCFRTPQRILDLWESRHGVQGLDKLNPHFEAVEKRLNIQAWPQELLNANNRVLFDGAHKLGWEATNLKRNVKGCMNSGYCGMGCPVNAKQGMLLTYIPDALQAGMQLYCDSRAHQFIHNGKRIERLIARVWNPKTNRPTETTLSIKAKTFVSSCGAINGPALFLRSDLNPNGLVGYRTFLHPVVGIAAEFDNIINGFYGAPQSASSHQFIERGNDKIGYFFEAAPTHPMLSATAACDLGARQQQFMSRLNKMSFLIALHRDGVMNGDEGGRVSLRLDGRVKIDYPVNDALKEAFQSSHKHLAQLALSGGAKVAHSLHIEPVSVRKPEDIQLFNHKSYGLMEHGIFTAHQMGGLPMGNDPKTSVVNSNFQHHHIDNLFVVDGSVFPSSLGVNPSLTIYGLAHRARDIIAATV